MTRISIHRPIAKDTNLDPEKADRSFHQLLGDGAEGGGRTLMPSLAPDFESSASAIPPLRQQEWNNIIHF